MALCEKHLGKMLVPWFNTNEWKSVYNNIFNESDSFVTRSHALQILHIWKIRTPKLPSGVEGTLIVLDALMEEKMSIPEERLRILYGTAIMRFLNLCGASGDKQGTFYKTAKQNNLPDWLIDLRHDIAHDQTIPSRCMLEMGLEVCLDWLKREYWEKQNATISDYVISFHPEIDAIVKLYCEINLNQYLNKCKSLIELNDPILMEKFEIIEDIVQIDVNMPINDVLTMLLETIKSFVTNLSTNGNLLSETIIESRSMFNADIFGNSIDGMIPHDFVIIWEPLLNFLYEEKMLVAFIKKLFDIISSETLEITKKQIANVWLTEVLKGLVLTKDVYDRYHNYPNHHELNKETAKIILKRTIQDENTELREVLNFDLDYYEDIKESLDAVAANIIQNANSMTLSLMKYVFKLRGLSNSSADSVNSIVERYVVPSNVDENGIENYLYYLEGSIYTTSNINEIINSYVISDENESFQPGVHEHSDFSDADETYWKIEDTSMFEGCPLGTLKGWDRETNPLLSFE